MPWTNQLGHKSPKDEDPSGKKSSAWLPVRWPNSVGPDFLGGQQSEKLAQLLPKIPIQCPFRQQTSWQANWCGRTQAQHFHRRYAIYPVVQKRDKAKKQAPETPRGGITIPRLK